MHQARHDPRPDSADAPDVPAVAPRDSRKPPFLSARMSPGSGYLFAGAALVACYAVVAIMFDNFALPFGADYVAGSAAGVDLGLEPRLFRDFHPYAIWSVLAKAIFLLPACLCFAVFCAHVVSRDAAAAAERSLRDMRAARVLVAVVLATALLVLFWSQLVFQGQPVYDDEYTYLFQAATLGNGELVAKTPPCPECFENVFILIDKYVWAGKYTSGHPLLLALSSLAGSPYIITILLSSLIPLLAFLVVRELYDRKTALITAILFTVSPFFLFTAATLMNHGTCLFFLLAFAFCYLRSDKEHTWLYPVAAGLALGVAFNIRPQCAASFGLPFAVWSALRIAGKQRGRFLLRHALIGLSFLGPLAWALYYNRVVTGHALTFPFLLSDRVQHSATALLTVAGQTQSTYTLLTGVFYGLVNFWRMNAYLFGWGVSLVFVLAVIWKRRFARIDALWAGVVACTAVIYLWFPSPGVGEIGPRYYFNMLLPFLVWSARGMILVHDSLVQSAANADFRAPVLVPAFVLLAVLMSFLTFYREQMSHYQKLSEQVAEPYRAVEAENIHNAIVAVRNTPPSGWVFGLRNNDPDLEKNDVIYIWTTSPRNLLALLDRFPERKAYGLFFEKRNGAYVHGLVPFSREALREAEVIENDRGRKR